MRSADDPRRSRPTDRAVVAGLALVGVLGLAIVAIGLGGVMGPGPTTPAPGTAGAPSPSASLGDAPTPPVTQAPTDAPSPSIGQPASPDMDPLLLGLLTEGDLPGLSSPIGPQEGSDYDIDDAAFAANDGIRVVSRVWQSLEDAGLAAVFDFRMQFPSDAAAAAYLDAAEPVLSEAAANDQRPIASPPVIGSDTRVYGLETAGDTGTVLLRTYLFRVGPVVAKVVAGGTDVEPATTDALAATAASRVRAAGRPAPGSPRPPASVAPTPPPTAPLPTGEALAALLLEHVPPAIGPSCVPDEQRLWAGELATLVCSDDAGGVTVTYSGFEGAEALADAFDTSLEAIDLSETAASCDLGPYLGDYQVEGEQVGRVVCWAEQGGQAIMWSDGRLAILAVAASPTLDAAGLYLWWLEAGPVP